MNTGAEPPASEPSASELSADAFAEKVFGSFLGAMECLGFFVGERLGWFAALANNGPATAAELAERTGTDRRYAREWLEMQATFGHLRVEPGSDSAGGRRYSIPAGVAEVMTDPHSLAYLGPLPRLLASVGPHLDRLLEAYRHGGGVSWAELGDHAREAQAALNRPWFERQLAPALAGVPELHSILSRPGARVVDVGCGAGWSTVALGRAYPEATVTGIDPDGPSLELARANAAAAGVAARVHFEHAGGADLAQRGPFDAAFAFECVHDMAQPVPVLSAVRAAVPPDGAVVVMDEAVADQLVSPGDEVERVMYGYSMFICLPDGRSTEPSVGTGTVMRPPILTDYARQAGFRDVEVLPIEGFSLFRFYRLHQ